jgi:hypothetical protein
MTPMMRKVSLAVGAFVVLLVLAKLLGLFSLLPPPPPKPPITHPTTWTITIHAVGGTIQYDPQVDFNPSQSQGGCQWAHGTPDPKDLKVCQNDIVQWKATTPEGEHDLIVFMTDKFLKDAAHPGNPSVTTFVGSNGTTTLPQGLVAALDTDPHEWYVVVIDKKDSTNSGHDDPRIKVGG